MRWGDLGLAIALLGGGLAPLVLGAHGHPPIFYDVLAFVDPNDLDQELGVGSPSQANPQGGMCSACGTNGPVTYSFRTPVFNATNEYQVWAGHGEFKFWLRTAQVDGIPSVPPGTTRVQHRLATSDGNLLGEATVSKSLSGLDPVSFAASFGPAEVRIRPGTHFVWNVTIDNGAGVYEREAAPYGVNAQYRFQVSLPRPQLVYPEAEIQAVGPTRADVQVGDSFRFGWTARNLGPGYAEFTPYLYPTGDGPGVSGLKLEGNASGFWLEEGQRTWGNLTGRAKGEGLWLVQILVYSGTGDFSQAQYLVNASLPLDVSGGAKAAPTATPMPADGCPGPVRDFSLRADVALDASFSCRLQTDAASVEWRIRLDNASGELRLRWVDAEGRVLRRLEPGAPVETIRIYVPPDGLVRLVVEAERFSGVLRVDAVDAGDERASGLEAGAGFDREAALPALGVLAVGLLAIVGLAALWRRTS